MNNAKIQNVNLLNNEYKKNPWLSVNIHGPNQKLNERKKENFYETLQTCSVAWIQYAERIFFLKKSFHAPKRKKC